MSSQSYEYYVKEAQRVTTIRQDTLDEVLNLIIDTRNDCFCNSLMQSGYKMAKEDLVKAVKRLKNGK